MILTDNFVDLISSCTALSFIFLNGCSTKNQAFKLYEAGIPAVIATKYPLLDIYGLDFAVLFYTELTKGLGEISLKNAFRIANTKFIAKHKVLNSNQIPKLLQERMRGNFDNGTETISEVYQLFPEEVEESVFNQTCKTLVGLNPIEDIKAPRKIKRILEEKGSAPALEELCYLFHKMGDVIAKYQTETGRFAMGALDIEQFLEATYQVDKEFQLFCRRNFH